MTARGTFAVELAPEEVAITGIDAMSFTKVFSGDLSGSSEGHMLAAGKPADGSAGYVAIEVVTASLGERTGTFALQQAGTMHDGTQELACLVVPGSATGDFAGMTGTLDLTIDDDGTHRYELTVTM